MAKWKCVVCNEEHGELPMDIAYARPQHYLEIPEGERERRVWFNQDTNADVCVIDGNATEQIEGISMARVHELVRAALPGLFE
jgi:uncharacterized protein DUF2199